MIKRNDPLTQAIRTARRLLRRRDRNLIEKINVVAMDQDDVGNDRMVGNPRPGLVQFAISHETLEDPDLAAAWTLTALAEWLAGDRRQDNDRRRRIIEIAAARADKLQRWRLRNELRILSEVKQHGNP